MNFEEERSVSGASSTFAHDIQHNLTNATNSTPREKELLWESAK